MVRLEAQAACARRSSSRRALAEPQAYLHDMGSCEARGATVAAPSGGRMGGSGGACAPSTCQAKLRRRLVQPYVVFRRLMVNVSTYRSVPGEGYL